MLEEQVAYYSSVVQFDAVCAALSANSQYSCEVALLQTLTDIRTDVITHMSITAELDTKYRGSRKSAIVAHDGMLIILVVVFHLYVTSLWLSYMSVYLSFCCS